MGDHGQVVGMRSFGVSGPGADVRRHFGFTAEKIAEAVRTGVQAERERRAEPTK